jgi:hypothetical protein
VFVFSWIAGLLAVGFLILVRALAMAIRREQPSEVGFKVHRWIDFHVKWPKKR